MRRLFFLALLLGCSSRTASPSSESRALLARFPTLAAGVATIEREGERFHPRVARAHASVSLPVRADGAFSIANGVRVDVRLREARAALGEVVDGWVVYRGGVEGGAIFQRPDAEGTEDHVLAVSPRTLSYDVELHGAAVRWVDSVIEILDSGGAPRIRMNAPTLIDAQGKKHAARVSVTGCPVDRSAASPWGRSFSPADRCTISIAWDPTLPHPVLVDPAWTTTSSMATGRVRHRAVLLGGGTVLVVGGHQFAPGTTLSSAELFDPSTKTWASAGAMAEARSAHALTTIAGSKALVVGGAPLSSTAEVYDPTSGWSTIASLPVSVGSPAAVDLGAKALVVGGGTSACELFDPVAGTWTPTGAMATPRGEHQAHLLSSGKVLAYGGSGSSAELWDGSTWAAAGSSSILFGSSVLLPGDKILAFSGTSPGDATTSSELWSSSSWTASGGLFEAVSLAPAAVVGGEVLVAGGLGASAGTATVQRWTAGAWGKASPMSVVRYGNTVTTLPGGTVLVAGGQTTGATVLSSAEIFGALAGGTACTLGADCASGACLGGFCCTSACPAATCDMGKAVAPTCDATGACGTVSTDCGLYACDSGACKTTCAADADCGSTAFCSGSACVAKKANGATAADPKECTSGFVGDGVCCDKACDGVCESCATGTCTAVMGAPKHGSCPAPGADPCSATSCDGTDGKSCKRLAGSEVSCRTASCDMGVETQAAQCDGSGTCPAAVTKECGAYACDGPACRRTCRSDVDCSKGSTCDTITHECLAADTCDGDHTIHSHSGADKDCSPYKCAKTDCLKECTASTACVEGFVCDTTLRQCVPPTTPNPDSGDSGGCGMSRSTHTSFPLLLLAVLALGRKRGHRA